MEYVLGSPILERNGGAIVRLADDARKCVVFLGIAKLGSDQEFAEGGVFGTGFLVSHTDEGGIYLITCRHVAWCAQNGPLDIRLNAKDGRGRLWHLDVVDWEYHPTDENIDVAVLRVTPPDWADCTVYPTRGFLTAEKLKAKDTGAGDLAYIVGLFYPLEGGGTTRNLPVVHTGHVALMADDEPIPMVDWRDKDKTIYINGYLIETNALPGASGSPAFVRRSIEMALVKKKKGAGLSTWVHGSIWLLGVYHGAWEGEAEPGHPSRQRRPEGPLTVPAGMGIVVPAIKVLEVLNKEKLRNERAAVKATADRKRAARPYSARSTTADNPSHKEDFTSLLERAAKKKPQAD